MNKITYKLNKKSLSKKTWTVSTDAFISTDCGFKKQIILTVLGDSLEEVIDYLKDAQSIRSDIIGSEGYMTDRDGRAYDAILFSAYTIE